MKNLIAFFVAVNFLSAFSAQTAFKQKDTLRFAPDSSYSRSIVRYQEFLLFGTSRNGIIALNEGNGQIKVVIPPSPGGEFRSVAVGENGIYGIISGDNGEIWRTNEDETAMILYSKGSFFDDLKIKNGSFVFLGDPEKDTFLLKKIDEDMLPVTNLNPPAAAEGEACYAASATTLFLFSDKEIAFISGGGKKARFHKTRNNGKKWMSVDLPMNGNEGCGPFSINFTDKKRGMIVGGCYTSPNDKDSSSIYTVDGGKTWNVSENTTNGYRSCVTGINEVQFACGTNGIDVSRDGGKTWSVFDKGNFCALLLEKNTLYVTTNKGYCLRYKL